MSIFLPLVLIASLQAQDSSCTEESITVNNVIFIEAGVNIVTPYLYTESNNYKLIIDKKMVIEIIQSRRKSLPDLKISHDLLEKELNDLEENKLPIDSDSLRKKLYSHEGEDQYHHILALHELTVIFAVALKIGKVEVRNNSDDRIVNLRQEFYSAHDPSINGKVSGVRFMSFSKKVFDYCFSDPN